MICNENKQSAEELLNDIFISDIEKNKNIEKESIKHKYNQKRARIPWGGIISLIFVVIISII